MQYTYYETYTETRHVAVDLPEGATPDEIRDAAYSIPSSDWESDDYEISDNYAVAADGTHIGDDDDEEE